MGANAGPDIVSDGLVLALDAADNNSFRGEPTTNLRTTNSNGQYSYGTYGGGQFTWHGIETSGEYAGWHKITATRTSTSNNLIMSVAGTSTAADTTYTATIEFVAPNNNLTFNVTGFSGKGDAIRIGNTNRYYRTWTNVGGGTLNWYLKAPSLGANAEITNGIIYFRQIQWEQKAYPTRWINGTRGTTVAAGGGWADISGNDNHGEILNGVTTDNDGNINGALDFDGTNDYIDLGTQFNTLTSFAVEGVFKTDITGADTYQNIFGAGPADGSLTNYTGIAIGNLTSGYSDESFHAIIGGQTYQAYVRNGSNFYFDNKYHHFVVNFEPGNNTIYIDGEQQSITYRYGSLSGDTGGLNAITNNTTYIGRRSYTPGSGYFNGKIPLLRIYNRGLTQQEALDNYNSLKSRFGL